MKIKDLPKIESSKKHPGEGHRGRLRERFLQGGLAGFHDYEIIELLLTLGTPRKDCKQIAKAAIEEFGSLREVLDAQPEDLIKIKGIGPSNAFGLKLFQAIAERYSRDKIPPKLSFNSLDKVAVYLQKSIGREKKEHFVMLSLDSRNNLIKVSSISIGAINISIVHPREIFKEAIQSSATQIIIAHNHSSGDTTPSENDIHTTKVVVQAGNIIGIKLVDHIIVTESDYLSLQNTNPDLFL
ncbi:MAG: repair protein RadC protein [Candidatus Jorgensenbacteria bacterium GW2011_GWA2_45_13]|uniref:Repair protein RadC protein n=1 Tax=Candidatus Jorgensenbacteria bacterium GW2011_GWA2_45_13 TaxID=1618662 RepID=A0A0G1L6M2_9BACT|nr:MAG: repair protein RadC protein [Candidatus Jorgensenbacteria bacterium GW2011_GWA2_45_13]